jgi:hypothetical protein
VHSEELISLEIIDHRTDRQSSGTARVQASADHWSSETAPFDDRDATTNGKRKNATRFEALADREHVEKTEPAENKADACASSVT